MPVTGDAEYAQQSLRPGSQRPQDLAFHDWKCIPLCDMKNPCRIKVLEVSNPSSQLESIIVKTELYVCCWFEFVCLVNADCIVLLFAWSAQASWRSADQRLVAVVASVPVRGRARLPAVAQHAQQLAALRQHAACMLNSLCLQIVTQSFEV
jgi:hypothetical protein